MQKKNLESVSDQTTPLDVARGHGTGKCVSVGCECGSERAAGPKEEEKGQNLKNVPAQKTPGG